MSSLPYITSAGNIDKAFEGIRNAAVPERVSQDFVKTILKIPGGSGDQMTSFLKKLGFTNTDGTPSELYKRFRNPTSSGQAVAKAIRNAYAPLYVRNEFTHELADKDLIGLLVEETGQAHDSNSVKYTFSCLKQLKRFSDFKQEDNSSPSLSKIEPQESTYSTPVREPKDIPRSFGLNLGYTINLNLPATSDVEVFDAIFKSLKQHLLRDDDA